jgi:hypothetical protein
VRITAVRSEVLTAMRLAAAVLPTTVPGVPGGAAPATADAVLSRSGPERDTVVATAPERMDQVTETENATVS